MGIFARGWVKYLLFAIISAAISLALLVLGILIFVGVSALGLLEITAGELSVGGFDSVQGNWPALVVIALIFGVVVIAVVTWLSLASNKLVYSVAEGTDEGIKAALKYSWRNFPAYFVVAFVAGLIAIAGFVLLVIPGVIFTVFLSLVTPVFILENVRGMAVLKRSWALVKGNFWPVLLRLALIFIISILISSLTGRFDNESTAALLSLVSTALQFILTFFGIAYTYNLYKDLARK
jgi:hypothetical protein